MTDDEYRKHECLARWVVEYNGCDPQRIKQYLAEIEADKKPIASIPGLRDMVRKAYQEMTSK